MQERVASSNRKTRTPWMLAIVAMCIAVSLFGWYVISILQKINPGPTPAPDPFPATDIVYGGVSELGFINADGSSPATFGLMISNPTVLSSWGRPMITGDNTTLLVTSTGYPGQVGSVFAAHPGQAAVDCKWWGIVRLAANQVDILLETAQGLEEYAVGECGSGRPARKVYAGVFGALSPDEAYAAEVRQHAPGVENGTGVVLHELATAEEKLLGEGNFPAWSRDGRWLAYTGRDGIYIFENTANAFPRRVVDLESPGVDLGHTVYGHYPEYQYDPPMASWSPDGSWLVYQVYSETLKENPAFAGLHYVIFKVNVETGEQIKLLDGGVSPFWRWPVEGP